MMFQLLGDWPGPGNMFVAAGTIIDASEPQWAGVSMPLNARALDQESLDRLCRQFHPDLWPQLNYSRELKLPDPMYPPPPPTRKDP
jgi:hypothetical protein